MNLALALAVVIGLVVGFISGAVLGSHLLSEARAVERRLGNDLRMVRTEAQWKRDAVEARAEAKRAQLEKDANDCFKVFSNDVEAIVKRLEALEQHIDQKICVGINPTGKS